MSKFLEALESDIKNSIQSPSIEPTISDSSLLQALDKQLSKEQAKAEEVRLSMRPAELQQKENLPVLSKPIPTAELGQLVEESKPNIGSIAKAGFEGAKDFFKGAGNEIYKQSLGLNQAALGAARSVGLASEKQVEDFSKFAEQERTKGMLTEPTTSENIGKYTTQAVVGAGALKGLSAIPGHEVVTDFLKNNWQAIAANAGGSSAAFAILKKLGIL